MAFMRKILGTLAFVAAFLLFATGSTFAAIDRCFAVADAAPAVHYAALKPVALKKSEVRLTYVGHSTFLLESPAGVRIATDYNDYVRPTIVPQIATMNGAHDTHNSAAPDPGIRHVLRGWTPTGKPARHDLTLKDVRVRNVPTNVRDWAGGTHLYGNSIFIFEFEGLCIAHLGHLHHTLTDKHLAQIGLTDIVLAPVDGGYTLDLPGMVEVLKRLRPRLIIPMHYFGTYSLNQFLEQIKAHYAVEFAKSATLVMSRAKLPIKPKVLVLAGDK